ncbi:glycoside hydrolase superfamily [Mycena olivaceomarginata]|nr:glycoside hydrolase superfamily [Mycena olivaceomarginata]
MTHGGSSTAMPTSQMTSHVYLWRLNFTKTYNLDGIDCWEYPSATKDETQIGCNQFSPEDSANFLAFLQTLRSTDGGKSLLLTAAVGIKPFWDSAQPPMAMTNVSEFASVLDHIAIMSYNIWGAWSTAVGPNAPLDDTCELPVNQQGSAVSAVAVWTEAGFPADQITLGVASYGRSYRVNHAAAFDGQQILPFPKFNATNPPPGPEDDPSYVDTCGNHTGVSGEFMFNEL